MTTSLPPRPREGADRATERATAPAETSQPAQRQAGLLHFLRLLAKDKLALVAAAFLTLVLLVAIFGPMLVGNAATQQHLEDSRMPPFHLSQGWLFVLGTDSLGRSILAMLIAGTRTDMSIVVPTVIISVAIGMTWGSFAGYWGGWREGLTMRIADVILSFPSLLLAAIVLYIFTPGIVDLVIVLAIARLPLFLRTSRVQVKEIRSRLFVDAARTFGTSDRQIVRRHIVPLVLPTTLTLTALDFSFVLLASAALSFLGLGVQPPAVSWGLMVAQGQSDLVVAWWEAVWPGLAIGLTALSAAILAAWLRLFADPTERSRMTQATLGATL